MSKKRYLATSYNHLIYWIKHILFYLNIKQYFFHINTFSDIPGVEIETDPKVYYGSKTTFRSKVSSIPSRKKVEWQTSKDGTDYHCIDVEDPKYYGSNVIPECPLLVIPKTKFDDKLYYRLLVWNDIGEGISNTVKLNVTGSMIFIFVLEIVY